jgi:hypothetical protein
MEKDLASRLDGTHPRLIAGPETLFAIFGLVTHFDLLESGLCLAADRSPMRIGEQRTRRERGASVPR